MANDFSQFSFNRSGYQEAGPINKTLVAGAAAQVIATLDLTPLQDSVTISIAVGVAALTGLDIYVRGDSMGEWLPMSIAQLYSYGRNDSGTDVTTTPAGTTASITVLTRGCASIQLRAKSAGAATISTTAGGK